MAFYRIKEWRQYQHYKDRSPPWIKLHRSVLTSRTWVNASDSERVLAVACMLIAADTDNKIPADPDYVRRVAYLRDAPDFAPLLKSQFLEFVKEDCDEASDSYGMLADGTKCTSEQSRAEQSITSASPPKRRSVSRGTGESPGWLLDFKLAYPNRAGDPAWRKAIRSANQRQAEGHTPDEFIAGAKRYAAFCDATGKVGTEYVMQASRFLGPDKPFTEPWDIPAFARPQERPRIVT